MTPEEDVLAAALLSLYDLTSRTTEAVSPTLDEHGLTLNTAYTLWAIAPDEPPPSMGVLAERTRCSPPNLTFLCDQLEARGLILRAVPASDRRQRVVKLTDAGRAARSAVVDVMLSRSPLRTLSRADLMELHRLLQSASDPEVPSSRRP
ncbi:MarR family winged helix-turn-helix transcriptional regulator [Nocardioides pantholopis]|uniref:MarR family winged helix-turn-helix transcriptional regulator n=1 Tax=Nocardioides pantholopis TaxID=2483798 RepID=UPI0013E2E7DB|nr:MarR family transcriptional regulator [Nocardioides pantholopis]